jgi:hypothetical protein
MKVKVIAHPLLILSALFFAKSEALQHEKSFSNKYECQIEFGKGKSDVSETDINHCLNKIPKDETIHFVQIISSADGIGSYATNKKLTDERLKKTQSYLLKNIKNSEIKLFSVGRNEQLGKKVYILLLANKPHNSITNTSDTLLDNKNKEQNPKSTQTAIKDDDNYYKFYNLYKSIMKNNNNNSVLTPITYDKKRY